MYKLAHYRTECGYALADAHFCYDRPSTRYYRRAYNRAVRRAARKEIQEWTP